MKGIVDKIGRFLTEQAKHKQRIATFLCLAVLVLYGTVTGLKLYGQAMNHKHDVLECSVSVHEHVPECLSGEEYACGYADYVAHVHDEACYDGSGTLACRIPEREAHAHTEDCFEEASVLACGWEEPEGTEDETAGTDGAKSVSGGDMLPECPLEEHAHGPECQDGSNTCGKAEHEHGDGCTEKVPSCGVPEHAHDDACEGKVLTCSRSEHAHSDGCYDADGELSCSGEHAHSDSCYGAEAVCGMTAHSHEDSCYEEKLVCETEEHAHGDACIGGGPICGKEEHAHGEACMPTGTADPEDAGHVHTSECYAAVKKAVCGELELHEHDKDRCFDADGRLICKEVELLAHQHGEECFVAKELTPEEIAEMGKAKGHAHTAECYEDGELACGYPADHAHKGECYGGDGTIACGYGTLAHVHVPKCYDDDGNAVCGYAGASHIHDENCRDADGDLMCGYDTASHIHTEECTGSEGALICGFESEKHFHAEECYRNGEPVCGFEAESHLHEDGCYDEDGHLTCRYESLYHAHAKECYGHDGKLFCGYLTERHAHEYACYDDDGNVTCGYEALEHEHTEECYDEAGNLACGLDESGERIIPIYCLEYAHTHTRTCYADGALACGKADCFAHKHTMACRDGENKLVCPVPETDLEAHEHSETCRDEDGALACGLLEAAEHVHGIECTRPVEAMTRVYEGDGYAVTAKYGFDAGIPKDAEFIAELITEDPEDKTGHYGMRLEEYRESIGDRFARMRALMKIGFYADGAEIEPEAPVTVTVQFFDDGDKDAGKPFVVVHFTEDGSERLESSEEDGRTVFEMSRFSEIALGYDADNVAVDIDETIEYDAGELKVTLTIKGEAVIDVSGILEYNREEDSDEVPGDHGSGPGDAADAAADAAGMESVQVTPVGSGVLDGLSFCIGPLAEGSEGYEALLQYARDMDGEDGGGELKGWEFALLYGDAKADLSGCGILAVIEPSAELVQAASDAIAGAGEAVLEPGLIEAGYTLSVFGIDAEGADGADIGEVGTSDIADAGNNAVTLDLTGMSAFGARVAQYPNPDFTVQYYAWLDHIASEDPGGADKLKIIDTDNGGTNGGGKLPVNGNTDLPVKEFYVDADGIVCREPQLSEVYLPRRMEYYKAPAINYMDVLAENPHYALSEIWILDEGLDTSDQGVLDDEDNWTAYPADGDVHFTNREISAEHGEYIFIYPDAVVRLVYRATGNADSKFTAAFYDYDITNGHIYRADPTTGADSMNYRTTGEASSPFGDGFTDEAMAWGKDLPGFNGRFYVYAVSQGINSPGNYAGTGARLAFGNNSIGTGLNGITWEGNLLNMANSRSFSSCTFGLAERLNADGTIQYSPGVDAPKLFNEGGADGKSDAMIRELVFTRSGDTYTLTQAGPVSGLDVFRYRRWNWNRTIKIFSNEFWPLDAEDTYSTGTHDIKFGSTYMSSVLSYANPGNGNSGAMPLSDYGDNHNAFFGMNYCVRFNLVDDYCGPLDYYFFGDDDMWAFLDGRLVCDIGGVHSSVGEYVNLWDYLHRHTAGCYGEDGALACGQSAAGDHELAFFYTERGASGSTCWMQFTLPSVCSLTPETSTKDYGQLKVMKTVVNVDDKGEHVIPDKGDNEAEFTFRINLFDAEGNPLHDDYAYAKYDRDDEEIGYNLIIWDGGTFTLKNGEYILVRYLPAGTMYQITEEWAGGAEYTTDIRNVDQMTVDYDGSDPDADRGIDPIPCRDLVDDKYAAGTVSGGRTAEVEYYNKFYVYGLPETGGTGISWYVLAGALALMAGAAGFVYKKRRAGA